MMGASPMMINEPHCGPIEFQKCSMNFSYSLKVICFVLLCFAFIFYFLWESWRQLLDLANNYELFGLLERQDQASNKSKRGVLWLHMGIFLGVSLVTIGVDVGHDKHGKHSSFVMVNMLWPHMPLNASRLNKTNVLDNQLHKYKMAKCKICLFLAWSSAWTNGCPFRIMHRLYSYWWCDFYEYNAWGTR